MCVCVCRERERFGYVFLCKIKYGCSCDFSCPPQVCCICLAKYADNDDLRELPCLHFFHVECVDKWLKINASCPLCKSDAGKVSGEGSPSAGDSS